MPSAWKPLDLHLNHNGIPPLLVKYEFGLSDYKVWLTDLSYIWTESLDRRQIVIRALNSNTSIDPSEDPAQMSLFFRSIEDALRQRPGTSMNLDESQRLTLRTSTPLPHPLQPLKWSIVFMLAPQPTFASEFVSPLLSQQLIAKVEKTSLLQQLKEKDKVISKLIDKMQGDGVDLGKVFPGAVSSKSAAGPNARWAIAKSIRGLEEFDEDQWQSQLGNDYGLSGKLGDFLAKVFDDDSKDTGEALQISDYGEWWESVGHKDSEGEGAAPAVRETGAKQESVVEDEFQRQLTPPKSSAQAARPEKLVGDIKPKTSSNLGDKGPDEGGSTTDESDDDLQSSHSKPLPLRLDGPAASDSANDFKDTQSEPMYLDDDGLTASGSDTDDVPAKTHSVPISRLKLGKIGGKGKESSPKILAVPTLKPRLGKIGGKGKPGKVGGTESVSSQNEGAASNKPEESVSPKREARMQTAAATTLEPESRGRTAQQPLEPSFPRETSQERANRKREQLKRELESKSQAATKKKRRF